MSVTTTPEAPTRMSRARLFVFATSVGLAAASTACQKESPPVMPVYGGPPRPVEEDAAPAPEATTTIAPPAPSAPEPPAPTTPAPTSTLPAPPPSPTAQPGPTTLPPKPKPPHMPVPMYGMPPAPDQ